MKNAGDYFYIMQQPQEQPDYQALYQELKPAYDDLAIKTIQMQHELEQLKKIIFGSRHERFVPTTSPEQLSLELQAEEQTTPAVLQQITYNRKQAEEKKNVPHRMPLPAHLPRETVVIEPVEPVEGCVKIGEEVTEELEYAPGKLFVRRYVRPKYARKQKEGIAIAELPVRPIEKGIAGPGLLAQIIIDKYIDHLPVYRQVQRFEREGVKLPVSTLSDWITATCNLLEPLGALHRSQTLASGYLQADETTIPVLDKDKKGSTHRGYYWVYNDPLNKRVLFDYREGRGREGPFECLKDFKGYLQCDGYDAYEGFKSRSAVTVLHCMAHARRKFDEALNSDKQRASHVLTLIQKLYTTERKAKNLQLSPENILLLRKEEAIPVLEELKQWLTENYPQVLPQSPIAKAIFYTLSRWKELCVYTTNGTLLIDNNKVENAIRPVALGRKNYLFAGSHQGAKRAAMLYSLLATCKIQQINPFDWLSAVLQSLPQHPVNQLDVLLPENWKKS